MSAQPLEKINIIPAEQAQLPAPVTPMAMLAQAVERGMAPEVIEKLMNLAERWDTANARKMFDEAMANAKAEIPTITKNREVDFTSQKGRTNYKYEDLGEIAKTIGPILAKHGLSYRYRVTSAVNEPVTVTCIVTHKAGHFEETTLCAGRDESGNKNSIQAIGSTLTYLQRMTLKAALGLAVSNDDDGRTSENVVPITDDQMTQIIDLIESTGSNRAKFRQFFQIDSFAALPAAKFQQAIDMLKQKAKG